MTAPGTGLLEEGSAVALAAAMFGATVVVVMIMLAIRPAMRRTSAQARVLARHVLAGSDPNPWVAGSDQLGAGETGTDGVVADEVVT